VAPHPGAMLAMVARSARDRCCTPSPARGEHTQEGGRQPWGGQPGTGAARPLSPATQDRGGADSHGVAWHRLAWEVFLLLILSLSPSRPCIQSLSLCCCFLCLSLSLPPLLLPVPLPVPVPVPAPVPVLRPCPCPCRPVPLPVPVPPPPPHSPWNSTELPDDPVLAQHLGAGEHEVRVAVTPVWRDPASSSKPTTWGEPCSCLAGRPKKKKKKKKHHNNNTESQGSERGQHLREHDAHGLP